MPYDHPPPIRLPTSFLAYWWRFMERPIRGYQIDMLDDLWVEFDAIDNAGKGVVPRDTTVNQARQSGKTVPMGIALGYKVVADHYMLALLSSKEFKVNKVARSLMKQMKWSKRKLATCGVAESRFEDESGFIRMSGRDQSEREGETAHIVYVDEAQDVNFDSVWPDISPFTLATGGIVLATGIGGVDSSIMETMRSREGIHRIDVPYQDVLDKWGVPDGRDGLYRRRVEEDKGLMRPEIFSAHYECQRIPEGTMALLKNVIPWSEAFPGQPFDPTRYLKSDPLMMWDCNIGVDWGKRTDASAALAVGFLDPPASDSRAPRTLVIYGYFFSEGKDYHDQADALAAWVPHIPYDSIKPELNNVGIAVAEILKRSLARESSTSGVQYRVDEVWMDDERKMTAADRISTIALNKDPAKPRLIYVDPAADPERRMEHYGLKYANRCASALRNVGIKYTESRTGTLRMKISHSDWLSALLAAIARPEKAVIS